MRRFVKGIGITAVVAAVAIQLIGPWPTNPPVDAARTLPTTPVFDRACRDCHSNETRWPWYSHVAPARGFVVGHVNHGRSHMNVSDWAEFTPQEADHKLATICKFSRQAKMPLPSYLLLHSEAKLTPDDIKQICDWTETQRLMLAREDGPQRESAR